MFLWVRIFLNIKGPPRFSTISVLLSFLDHSTWKTYCHSFVISLRLTYVIKNSSTFYLLTIFFLVPLWLSSHKLLFKYCLANSPSPLLPCWHSLFSTLETEMPYIHIPTLLCFLILPPPVSFEINTFYNIELKHRKLLTYITFVLGNYHLFTICHK